jgi:hypothetical protein
MSARADITVSQTAALLQFNGGGVTYLVQTPSNVLYYVYTDPGSDVMWAKSTDGGFSWSTPVTIFAGTVTALSIWYDRWSDIAAGLIHVVYTESVTDDTFYRSIDTESSDTLSTQTTVFLGASTAAGGSLVITRARGGNLHCRAVIDAGAEGGHFRSTDVGGTWSSVTAPEAISTQDMMLLAPGFAADNQDLIGIFWDTSANEVSRYLYDDSANTWAETSIATSMSEQAAATAFPHFALTVDIANSQIIMISWNAIDAANQDLRCWTITESAITEVTNVVLNATDDCGLAAIAINIDDGYWYAFYAGKSDGSETFLTSVNAYYKVSQDSGTTWGTETKLTTMNQNIKWIATAPRFFGPPFLAYLNDTTIDQLNINVAFPSRRANLVLGI